jgi:hypothetical protein
MLLAVITSSHENIISLLRLKFVRRLIRYFLGRFQYIHINDSELNVKVGSLIINTYCRMFVIKQRLKKIIHPSNSSSELFPCNHPVFNFCLLGEKGLLIVSPVPTKVSQWLWFQQVMVVVQLAIFLIISHQQVIHPGAVNYNIPLPRYGSCKILRWQICNSGKQLNFSFISIDLWENSISFFKCPVINLK